VRTEKSPVYYVVEICQRCQTSRYIGTGCPVRHATPDYAAFQDQQDRAEVRITGWGSRDDQELPYTDTNERLEGHGGRCRGNQGSEDTEMRLIKSTCNMLRSLKLRGALAGRDPNQITTIAIGARPIIVAMAFCLIIGQPLSIAVMLPRLNADVD
jgi:hypothetical protein